MLGEDMDGGFELCMELRNMSPHLPVIFLTARDSDADRISSQRMTAWDYITKPVSLEFLVARVHSILRIAEQLQQPVDSEASIKVDHLEIDERSMSVVWRNEIVNLTLTEFWLVESLAQGLVERNTINGYIRRVRNKFRLIDPTFDRIQTVHGTGYKWAHD